jgi:hypothetical protein
LLAKVKVEVIQSNFSTPNWGCWVSLAETPLIPTYLKPAHFFQQPLEKTKQVPALTAHRIQGGIVK